ncbi:MAG: HlyD family efflux transporter periplasmic adaptor subunit [Muribaculaceae bacterium]|nr:HlyD family efflux transporter periplasmic adaptor subunit [Muribaculaceae bacterium]
MDKEIPKEQLKKERRKLWMKWGLIGAGVVALIVVASDFIFSDSVKEEDLVIKPAELGTLESSVSASGKIVPLYEQAIVSPVSTRIMEVYRAEGDSVEAGESLLRLDLQSAESDVRRMSDQVSMKNNEIEQTALNNATYLTDLEMKIKSKEMAVSHLKAEVANERRLDSIGSGTGDRIRQAELAYSTGLLELEQLRTQLRNERKAHAAAYRSKQLEGSITRRDLLEMERTLEDARVKAPRKGTITYLNKDLGVSIAAGEKLAIISDLSHFKIDGDISEGSAGKIAIGAGVNIRIGRHTATGHVSNIIPQSKEGMTQFSVIFDNDNDPHLRSGLRTELNIIYDQKDGVVRIPNGQYFQGAGDYVLFVKTTGDRLERRKVTLGESNFDYVEVVSGIKPGEMVVISDMSTHKKSSKLRMKPKS